MNTTRLNKAIADSGLCSRRKADEFIKQGLVKVNGKLPKMGQKVLSTDKITVKDKKLKQFDEMSIMLHKPAGLITSKGDPHNKNTVMSILPNNMRHLKPAGRLDKDSEGLLILSSDGNFIQKITHPKFKHTKTYEIIVKGYVKEDELFQLTTGKLKLDGYALNPMKFEIMGTLKGRKTRISLVLTEGRKRQIRRVMDHLGFPVILLKRTHIGTLDLGTLPIGEHRVLSPAELYKALA
ncbi:MAG: 23S rRNA pseudouridine2605 synthase [Oceanicoccus sp.]|jgi:23S rRNA pseudouridine2605 synthase